MHHEEDDQSSAELRSLRKGPDPYNTDARNFYAELPEWVGPYGSCESLHSNDLGLPIHLGAASDMGVGRQRQRRCSSLPEAATKKDAHGADQRRIHTKLRSSTPEIPVLHMRGGSGGSGPAPPRRSKRSNSNSHIQTPDYRDPSAGEMLLGIFSGDSIETLRLGHPGSSGGPSDGWHWKRIEDWPDFIKMRLEANGINAEPSEQLVEDAISIYLCQFDGNWGVLIDDLEWGLVSFSGYTLKQVYDLLPKVDISVSGLDILGELEALEGKVVIEEDAKALETGSNKNLEWLKYLGMR